MFSKKFFWDSGINVGSLLHLAACRPARVFQHLCLLSMLCEMGRVVLTRFVSCLVGPCHLKHVLFRASTHDACYTKQISFRASKHVACYGFFSVHAMQNVLYPRLQMWGMLRNAPIFASF